MENKNATRYLPLAAAILLTPLVVGLVGWELFLEPAPSELAVVAVDPFSPLQLEAKAALVYDPAANKVIFAKNGSAPLPIASITKLMTAYLANQELPASEVLTTINGRHWLSRDLINFTLITSYNDGAAQLAAAVARNRGGEPDDFVSEMNLEAARLGLTQTRFANPTGLDIDQIPGAESSAVDVAKLMTVILNVNPELLSITTLSATNVPSLEGPVLAINTNPATKKFPGLFASKTGFTDLAGGNLAIAFDAGLYQPIIIVVLGSSEKGRVNDTLSLAKATINWFALRADNRLE